MNYAYHNNAGASWVVTVGGTTDTAGIYSVPNDTYFTPTITGTFQQLGWEPPAAPTKEERMKASEKWLVVARESGAVAVRCESAADAEAEAARLAAKHEDEYIVFQAIKRIRPKPDVETIEA